MPCTPFELPDGTRGIICTKGPRPAPCFYCGKTHERLCDFPVAPGKTCDRKLCGDHAHPAGKGRDHCPDHVNAKPPSVPAGPLKVFTGSVHRHRGDPDALDVTIMTGGPAGRPFAPSMELFKPAKGVFERVEAMKLDARARELANDLRGAAELRVAADKLAAEAWAAYRRGYLAEMIVSSGREAPDGWGPDVDMARRRGVAPHVEAWAAELARPRRVYLCFEPGRERCHRGLLAAIFVKLGAVDGGELAAAPAQGVLFSDLASTSKE